MADKKDKERTSLKTGNMHAAFKSLLINLKYTR
ncbi:MAG: hypothetical protein ACI9SC_003134 [Gammaproteobacteria bacterium]|jgi:hypothetical protein